MSKGWSTERRIHQATIIKNWKPWKQATGPKTEKGKQHSSRNAYKGSAWLELRQAKKQLRQLLKRQQEVIDEICP